MEGQKQRGVRQCRVTLAYLFCHYIDDMFMEDDNEKYGSMLSTTELNVQAYADNLVIYCPSASSLREILQKMGRLMIEIKLKVNTGITKVMTLNGNAAFTFENVTQEHVEDSKNLGCIISQ